MPKEKPILDYASNRRLSREIDLRFWMTLSLMLVLLVVDISCLTLFGSYD
ncbi:MAG TPA: hypothetical protein VGR35_00990 [Tepidisphaeraceae bacterium]|nr:hypothetical protein [Tepidisphaeraceae bacterium]